MPSNPNRTAIIFKPFQITRKQYQIFLNEFRQAGLTESMSGDCIVFSDSTGRRVYDLYDGTKFPFYMIGLPIEGA